MLKFKNMYTFEERKLESERIKAKYPDRVPGNIYVYICIIKK